MTDLENAKKQFEAAKSLLAWNLPTPTSSDLERARAHTALGDSYLRLAELRLHHNLAEPSPKPPEPVKNAFSDGVRPVDTPQKRRTK